MTVNKQGEFEINLLGPWQVTKNGEPLTDFRGDSVRALFTYLIIENNENSTAQSRRFIASLLWEDLDEEAAMRNVRVSLTRLRKGLADDKSDSPLIYTDRQSVGIDPNASYKLDTEQFEQAIAHARRSIEPNRPPDRRVLARLKRAVGLYRADFLQGFTHPSLPFEAWMLVRRERFHADALWGMHVLGEHALRVQDWHTAVDYAQRQIELEAWREEGFRQLIRAQIGLGQRSAAIGSYERCKRVLWDELGVEPDAQTEALYAQAKAGEGAADGKTEKPNLHNLPTAGSNFFSREAEIDFLLKRLGDPDGRLTTILGEGGIGKSRLSQYVGLRVLRDFKDGVWFVPLDHIEMGGESRPEADRMGIRFKPNEVGAVINGRGLQPTGAGELNGQRTTDNGEFLTDGRKADIVRLMIDTLGVPLAGNRPDIDQLLGWLARKEILLILDNFEHVLGAADLVNDILEASAGAVVIATSRIPLNLRQEAILPLHGLDITVGPEHAPASAAAVRMFFDRADRAGAAYETDEATVAAVADTCEQVGGNALAIELAAVWMRQMSAVEITAAVRESIDFLATTQRDMPERHRSMRAVFDTTWRLLTQDAQQAFAKLSVFHGGFSADAAIDIVQTNRQMLGLLQDRSLIHRLASGRFTMRPLVRQYADERLASITVAEPVEAESVEPEADLHSAHAGWYLNFMAAQKGDLMGANPWDAIERIELDIENIRVGWHHAVGSQHAVTLQVAAEPLSEYYNIRGRFQEALDAFSAIFKNNQLSTSELTTDHRPPNTEKLAAHAAMHKTRFLVRLGRYKDGEAEAKEAVRLARLANDDWCVAMGYVWWCQAFWEQGLTQEALAVLEKGERFREPAGDRYLDGRFHHQYSVCYSMQGSSEQAFKKSKSATELFTRLNSVWHNAMSLNTFGIILFEKGDFLLAKSTYEEITNLIQVKYVPAFLALIYGNLAITLQKLNFHSEAKSYLEQVLTIYQSMGLRSRELYVYTNSASLSFDSGDLDSAEKNAKKAIKIANEFGKTQAEAVSIVILGDVSLARNEFKIALSHYLNAAEVADQNQFQQLKAEILFGISQCFAGLEDNLQAKAYAKDATFLAAKTHQIDLKLKIDKFLYALN